MLGSAYLKIKRSLKYAIDRLSFFWAAPCEDPVLVLGNQKSGTSAISALLGMATKSDVQVDFFYKCPGVVEDKIHSGEMRLDFFIKKHPCYFSSKIIKEPGLTFCYEQLVERFPKGRFLFILRDPRDNIRSLLDRLSVPGDLDEVPKSIYDSLPNDIWRSVLDGKSIGVSSGNYIERMGLRWLKALEVYEANKSNFVLVRYEDFNENKQKSIKDIAIQLGLNASHDIRASMNQQFQRGGNKNISSRDFFGEANLRKLNLLVGVKAKEYGYE